MAGVPCELSCADAHALRLAAALFRGSLEARPSDGAAALRWRLAPQGCTTPADSEDGGWLIQRDGTHETWRRRSLDVALRCVEFGSVMALVDGGYGLVTLHGALLDRAGRGLLVLGPCESGKSTLAAALWRDGWSLLGDDVAVVCDDGRARPLERRVSLRHGSRELLGEALWQRVIEAPSCSETGEGYLFHPADAVERPQPTSTTLAAIVFLARRGVRIGAAEMAPINAAQALLAVAPYSNVIRRHCLPPALDALRTTATTAPVFDLGRGPLPLMVEAIERQVLSAGSSDWSAS